MDYFRIRIILWEKYKVRSGSYAVMKNVISRYCLSLGQSPWSVGDILQGCILSLVIVQVEMSDSPNIACVLKISSVSCFSDDKTPFRLDMRDT